MSDTITAITLTRPSGTHGDILAAAGLADLLGTARSVTSVRLQQVGPNFEIRPSCGLSADQLSKIPQAPGYPFLLTNEKITAPAGAQDVVNYKGEKEKVERVKQAEKAAKKVPNKVDPETQQLIEADKRRDDWSLLQVLNVLQGDETSNKVHRIVVDLAPAEYSRLIERACRALESGNTSGVDWGVSLVQLFSPNAAKGYCRIKPDRTDRNDKSKEQWSDDFLEWMKFRGFFRVACPVFVGDGDIRIICPVPKDISISALESVAAALRTKFLGTRSPKIDSMAVLYLAETLIRHSEEFHGLDATVFPGLSLAGKSPASAVSGVAVTHYQSMGSSKAITSMSTISLPGWFPIHTRDDADAFLEILDEHQRIIRRLQDNHSDEIDLVLRYRAFLQQRGDAAVWKLLEFMEVYGPFVIRMREQKHTIKAARAFRADLLGRLILAMVPKFSEILNDVGFQAVATAVRKATVSAQAQKAMGSQDYREIRYELLHELKRKRTLPGGQPFIESLADFISSYNQENARRREQKKRAPKNVTTEELESLIRLVESHGASTIGALLCAYGSCREPHEQQAEPEEAEEPEELAVS